MNVEHSSFNPGKKEMPYLTGKYSQYISLHPCSIFSMRDMLCFYLSPDSEDEDLVKKSKKSPKVKQKNRKMEPKNDPVQYVLETGDFIVVYYIVWHIAFPDYHDIKSVWPGFAFASKTNS